MRFGFSTLGCSGEPLHAVAGLAASTGWRGVELRAAAEEPVHLGLSAAGRAHARDLLVGAGVTPFAVASYVKVADASIDDDAAIAAALAHVELAADLGADYVRLFPGGVEGDDDVAVARLRIVAQEIGRRPVTVAVETHDSHRRGADIARILERVADGRVAAIWDALHPWLAGEDVTETATALRDRIAYVQIKDVASRSDRAPAMLGSGAVPLRDVAAVLDDIGYDGWVSLEWESRWYPDAAPLGGALAAAGQPPNVNWWR